MFKKFIEIISKVRSTDTVYKYLFNLSFVVLIISLLDLSFTDFFIPQNLDYLP